MSKTTNIADPGTGRLLDRKPAPLYAHPLRIFWRGKFPLDMVRRLRLIPRTESDSRVMIRSLDSGETDAHSADFVKYHKAHAPRIFAAEWSPREAIISRAMLERKIKITRIDALDLAGNVIGAWEFEQPNADDAVQHAIDDIFNTGDTQKIPHEVRK